MKIGLLDTSQKYLLSLSGGIDSVFLFHMLRRYKHQKFSCVYVNHHIGDHDNTEESFCRELCGLYNIDLHVLHVTLDTTTKGFENSLRELRYNAIHNIINDAILLVAHHIDDNIETIVHNIFRGTGINGLCGIKEKSFNYGMHIYRPLVNYINKKQIEAYMYQYGFSYIDDPSNKQPFTKRNVIRNIVLPLITSHYSNVGKAILHLSQRANESIILHESLAQIDAYNSNVRYCGNHIMFYHSYLHSHGLIRYKNVFYYIFNGRNNPKLKSVTVDNIIKTVDKHIDCVGKKIAIDNVTVEIIENGYFHIHTQGE